MITKILGFIAVIASGAALFFRGQMFKSREARTKDRENVKDKSREIRDKSVDLRRKGEKQVRNVRKEKIDYTEEDEEF